MSGENNSFAVSKIAKRYTMKKKRKRPRFSREEQLERKRLLEAAKPYCNRWGRVVKMMPESIVNPLRKKYQRMFGFERDKPCQFLGTSAHWYVMFAWKKQGKLYRQYLRELQEKRNALP